MSISIDAENAREGARRSNGKFGEQHNSAPEATLGGGVDLSNHTPVDIDSRLSEIYAERAAIMASLKWRDEDANRKRAAVEKAEAAGERYEGQLDYLTRVAEEAEAKLAELWEAADRKTLEAGPYEAEFTARGGWTRAFLATSTNGHVHRSMSCPTCNRDGKPTGFAWMTEYSGLDEDLIVGDAGERACTSCFPTAPVDVLKRATKMFTPDEKRKAEERTRREQAKTERQAKVIANALTDDGSELVVQTEPGDTLTWRNTERFKTERAAVIWATDHLYWAAQLDHQPERQQTMRAAVRTIAEAVARKHGTPVEYVLGEMQIKQDVKSGKTTRGAAKQQLAALAEKHGLAV